MGSPADEPGRYKDETPHRVTISQDFWLGKYEVTQAQWEAVMGSNPSTSNRGGNYPVENISWDEAKEFCERLNNDASIHCPSGYRFDLPTEAQWEYAARGGKGNRGFVYSGSNNLGEVAWYGDNSGRETHPVGGKKPNALGLYDMSGNVWEWCRDWHGPYGDDATNPTGPQSGRIRVGRGGGWDTNARFCRAALRGRFTPSFRFNDLGFRLALVRVQ